MESNNVFFTLFRQYFREKKASSYHHHHNNGGSRFEPIPGIQQTITKKEIQIQSKRHYNYHNCRTNELHFQDYRGTAKHHSSPHHQNQGGSIVSQLEQSFADRFTQPSKETPKVYPHSVMITSFIAKLRFLSGG